jgi:acid phosphatase (class A)
MQPSRILAAVLIVFLSGTGPLSAQKLIYLEGKKLNLLKLLPPPPEPGSEGEKKDILEVLEVQENRTPAEVALGIADDVLDIYRFETELGSKFKAANLPVTDAFFKRLHQDTRTYVMLSKEYWSRERPVKASKDVRPLRSVRLPTAYPSGTTLFGAVTGIVLANMVPEKRYDLFERGRQFSKGRVVIGVHYPRDVLAGEIAATLIASAFFQTPAFVNDFEAARAELRQVLGYPAQLPDEGRGHTAANPLQ